MRNCISQEAAEQVRGTKCIKKTQYVSVVNLIQWHFLETALYLGGNA